MQANFPLDGRSSKAPGEEHPNMDVTRVTDVKGQEPPSKKAILNQAKEILSQSLYPILNQKDLSSVKEKCQKILLNNLDQAHQLNDVNKIAKLIFQKYIDDAINAVLPTIYEKCPSAHHLENIEAEIREKCHVRSRMYHCIAIKQPIIAVIKDQFPDLDCSARINLAAVE